MKRVYFDNAATTPLLEEVKKVMQESMDLHFGNPSSIHHFGRISKNAIENCRKEIASRLECSIGEIYFTSSATEGNNLVINQSINSLGVLRIITSPTEHPCVAKCVEQYKDKIEIVQLDVDQQGKISLDQLESYLKDQSKKTLVSLMHANNEIGTFHPIDQISSYCQNYGALFHSDTVQSIAKVPINLKHSKISFLTASAHKFHGPKGIGFIYINANNNLDPILIGGAQERNMRAGTENILGICGLAKAFGLAFDNMDSRKKHIENLKNKMKTSLLDIIPQIKFNGDQGNCLHTILNCSFPYSDLSEMIMFNLDINGICASAGSACSSGVEHASPVLEAIGHDPLRKAIRFSFSHLNTIEEVEYTISKIKNFM